MPLGTEVGLCPRDIVLDGDPALPKKGIAPPILAYVYCGQTTGWIRMPLNMEIGLGRGHIVLDWGSSCPQKDTPPFLAHVCCGQTAGWIEMKLGVG